MGGVKFCMIFCFDLLPTSGKFRLLAPRSSSFGFCLRLQPQRENVGRSHFLMAGMLQILTYLLAFYLIIKGIEVLQIGLASSR
jgi:hypothetical protein